MFAFKQQFGLYPVNCNWPAWDCSVINGKHFTWSYIFARCLICPDDLMLIMSDGAHCTKSCCNPLTRLGLPCQLAVPGVNRRPCFYCIITRRRSTAGVCLMCDSATRFKLRSSMICLGYVSRVRHYSVSAYRALVHFCKLILLNAVTR